MVTVTDKSLHQEKETEAQLMQLVLVDIANGQNSNYNTPLERNYAIDFIINSSKSFKMVVQVIKMTSTNFLKPY